MLIFLGIKKQDSKEDVKYLVNKIIKLRMFNDSNNLMNLSVSDKDFSIMVVNQFTLYGNCKKGNRPSFVDAETPQKLKNCMNYLLMN